MGVISKIWAHQNCLHQATLGSTFILKTWESSFALFWGREGALCEYSDWDVSFAPQVHVHSLNSVVRILRLSWPLVYENFTFKALSFVNHFTTLAELLFSKWGDWTRAELVNSKAYGSWQVQQMSEARCYEHSALALLFLLKILMLSLCTPEQEAVVGLWQKLGLQDFS